ncbi:unnamed protein product [Ilex paraguariensis]|uniref:Uncharacterized protein n=1 Tax=Ilex paraguariensis TaxID=185542 RepID=A0ABC8RG80_9AQUA
MCLDGGAGSDRIERAIWRAEFDVQFSQYDESDRTPALRDQIFHKLFGEDGHGYCKTYGTDVPRSLVYQKDKCSSDAPNPAFIEKICHTVCEKLELKIKAEFDKVHARIGVLESQADNVGGSKVNAN